MNLFQFADADLCVDLRGLQLGMTEHGLDEADVGSVLQHQRGHRVTEQMARATFADVGRIDVFTDHLSQPVCCEPFAKMSQEQRHAEKAQKKGSGLIVAKLPSKSIAVGTAVAGGPRTDPYVKNYLIRFLP